MLDKIDNQPVTTILLGIAFIIVVIVGGIICITDDSFEFQDYATSVSILAGALGLLGVGRGILKGEKARAGADALTTAHRLGEEYEEPLYDEDPDAPPEDVPPEDMEPLPPDPGPGTTYEPPPRSMPDEPGSPPGPSVRQSRPPHGARPPGRGS